MPTLRIEHSISDFRNWNDAFLRFADRRKDGGVRHERIMQPVDDLQYVLVDLEFDDLEHAQRFLHFRETQVWTTPSNSPAFVGTPHAQITDDAASEPR